MARLLQRNKDIVGCEIREYIENDKRYFTATILKWNGFKFVSDTLTSQDLLINYVIPKVRAIRDELKGSLDNQLAIIEQYPNIFNY